MWKLTGDFGFIEAMMKLSESNGPVKKALNECLQARVRERKHTAYLWVHVIGNYGQVHFYPTGRADIKSPEDELLGRTIWHIADFPEWDEDEMDFTLSDGTTRRAGDAEERQRIIAGHVEEVVRAALSELPPAMRPGRVAVHSEWGEHVSEWSNKFG